MTADGQIKACRTAREFLEQLKCHLGTDCFNAVRVAGGLAAMLVKDGVMPQEDDVILLKRFSQLKLQKYVTKCRPACLMFLQFHRRQLNYLQGGPDQQGCLTCPANM